jgi:outer membrane lipoprotein carrier protein
MFRSVLALALSVSAVRPETVASQISHQVEERYNHARTLVVEFAESFQFQGHTRPEEAGRLTLRKAGKMRWDYSRPEGKVFVSDGKTLYLYTAGDNRVEKIPVRNTEDMRAPLAFLLGHLDFKRDFKSLQTRAGEGGTWLEASAKDDHLPYERVEMLVGGSGSIERLKIYGRDGSQTGFVFTNERLNPEVDDKIFQFAIPAGADVVDAVEFGGEGK